MPLAHSPLAPDALTSGGDCSANLLLPTQLGEEASRLTPHLSDHVLTPLLGDHVPTLQHTGHAGTSQHSGHAVATGGQHTEAIQRCRVPPFWKTNPDLWFYQVESLFQTNQVRSDDGKYHLVVGALDAEALQDVADILRNPPSRDKYQYQ